jgi:Tol biopolymer transport system component
MRKFAVRAASTYLILALLLAVAQLVAPLLPAGVQIAFTGNFDDELDIWLLDLARGLLVNLTRHDPGAQYSASWSPDGARIVYETGTARYAVGGGAADTGLHILDLATGAISRLPPTSDLIRRESPAWSPDGNRIVYEDGEYVRVYDLLTAQETVVARGGSPAWAGEGAAVVHLAYSRSDDRVLTHVQLSSLDGTLLGEIDSALLNPRLYWGKPNVSPDGQSVSLRQVNTASELIYTFDFACFVGCARPPLSVVVGDDPRWSPDGALIVYTCYGTGQAYGNLCAVHPDGTSPRALTSLRRPLQAHSPAVRPVQR